ncbi:P-II family nitrogen regulator [Alloscardovia theropitheci]|uniref:P-II family nitrogen regulator n=1 Tax=Alloscardovia theropitheci TaxID=2496842 RepID=A0A4R0QZX3_9BIFI|nr:P-II family nitrogen regulator [Alloscardovia theropitheci]TCD54246.1 P-II family nitrogen regulator [Alloscardovia theropitheci]
MKLITAIIQPDKLDDVADALAQVGVHGLTISEANGYGRQRGHTEVFRGTKYDIDILPKVRFEIVCEDGLVETIVQKICDAAKTGTIGDGKVWVIPVESITRVRTGETGAQAL